MDKPQHNPSIQQPRQPPPGPKVRVLPRQISKPQAASQEEVALDPNAPPAPSEIRFQCPACFGMLTVPLGDGYDGSPAPCPLCHQRITAPRLAGEEDRERTASSRPSDETERSLFRPDRQRADFHFVEGSFRLKDET